MKLTVEGTANEVIDFFKSSAIQKENADNAVEEQNRQEIINKQIELLIEASKHVQWDKLPSVSLALDTLLKNQRAAE